jgi:hypothetical protein
MRVLTTPPSRFENLPDFGYEPRYADVGGLNMAYVEAGPADGRPAPAPAFPGPTRKCGAPLISIGR